MYFDWYIPTAIRMGKYFKSKEGPESHIYTMHSYIASLYMSCPSGMGLHCPSEAEQQEFCQAVKDGHISWTAFPYNAQVEMMDEETVLGALQLTHDLDHLCGVPVKTVISQVRRSHFPCSPLTHPRTVSAIHAMVYGNHLRSASFRASLLLDAGLDWPTFMTVSQRHQLCWSARGIVPLPTLG